MKILVAVDFSNRIAEVIEQAKKVAQTPNSKVWLIHVTPPDPDFVGYSVGPQSERDFVAHKFRDEHKMLQEYAKEFHSQGIECTALLVQGSTVTTIVEESKKLSVDIIVMGTHNKSAVMKIILGSTSEGVLKHSTLPVLLVPDQS